MLSEISAIVADARRHGFTGPPGRGMSWRITNALPGRTDVYLYDVIGDGATAADELVPALAAIDAPEIRVRINSPGGSVWDGLAVYAALIEHPSRVVAVVDGIAASAASFVLQAADDRVMRPSAKLMIHNAQGAGAGDAGSIRKLADILDDATSTIADIYAARSGRPRAGFVSAMAETTWYPAADAIAAGLADRTDSPGGGTAATNRARIIRARAQRTPRRGYQ